MIHFVGKGRGGFGGISFKTGMERRKWVNEAIFIVFIYLPNGSHAFVTHFKPPIV
jgi:hypothetical protein